MFKYKFSISLRFISVHIMLFIFVFLVADCSNTTKNSSNEVREKNAYQILIDIYNDSETLSNKIQLATVDKGDLQSVLPLARVLVTKSNIFVDNSAFVMSWDPNLRNRILEKDRSIIVSKEVVRLLDGEVDPKYKQDQSEENSLIIPLREAMKEIENAYATFSVETGSSSELPVLIYSSYDVPTRLLFEVNFSVGKTETGFVVKTSKGNCILPAQMRFQHEGGQWYDIFKRDEDTVNSMCMLPVIRIGKDVDAELKYVHPVTEKQNGVEKSRMYFSSIQLLKDRTNTLKSVSNVSKSVANECDKVCKKNIKYFTIESGEQIFTKSAHCNRISTADVRKKLPVAISVFDCIKRERTNCGYIVIYGEDKIEWGEMAPVIEGFLDSGNLSHFVLAG